MKLSKFSDILLTLVLLLLIHLQRRKKRLQQEMSRIVYKKLDKRKNECKRNHALNHQIFAHCRSLHKPNYIPPTLFSGSWANMVLSWIKQRVYENLFYSKSKFRRKIHVLDDGEKTAYAWLAGDALLPPTAPIVFMLHTICGNLKDMQMFMDYCVRRGWRPCALIRRGHLEDECLSRPCFNLLGDPDDAHSQMKAALSEYPDTDFVGLIGQSAGSGLLVNYLGKYGEDALVSAACCICPAYDLRYAFKKIRTRQPTLDEYVLQHAKKLFLERNSTLLRKSYPDAYRKCSQAGSLYELLVPHAKFAGCKDVEDYYLHHNPAQFYHNIRVPMLVLNSDDDLLCFPDNIQDDWFTGTNAGMGLLLRTPRGAHVAYNEAVFEFNNYMDRVSLDFLDSSRHVINAERLSA